MTNMNADRLHTMKLQALKLLHGNHLGEAQGLLSQVCEQNAGDVDAWYLLGCIHGMQGNVDEVGRCSRHAIALRPDHADAHVNLGNALFSRNQVDAAVLHYQTALRINPNNAGALCNLGNALSSQGKHTEATASYQAALRLNPNLVEAYYNLGNSQVELKNYGDAVENFQYAIRLNPNYAAAYNNLGNIHRERGDAASAMENYRTAIGLQPNFARAYNNLAIALKEQGLLQEAHDAARHALRIQCDFAEALFTLGNILMEQNEVAEAIVCLQQLLKIAPHHPGAYSCLLMVMHYRPEYSAERLFTAAREWGINLTPQVFSSSDLGNTPDPRRRLRIGYVSGDFFNHPVGYFIEPVIAHHDRVHYEIFCYYNYNRQDGLTTRLQQYACHWRNVAGQGDEDVIRQIRRDGIDILIDLSGHTDRNRMLVFAHKPAPVQLTWLGYFDTTGLGAMDYIIADRFIIPQGEERHYAEQVWRLPNAYLCFSPPDNGIKPGSLPAQATGKLTFGCFNNPAKLTEAVIACWSRLLHALPSAQLHLKYKSFGDSGIRRRYQILFAQQGIDIARIRFAGASPHHEYLAAYEEVDIGLDPFPFNGCTTTMESLWMGVPVVTLCGDRYVGHMGESIMMNIGLEECIADSEEAYIARAVALAADLPRLAKLRSDLRERLLKSSLCDGPGFTRDLEAAYRRMWEIWCQAQASIPEGGGRG
jgi:predicted O-linked N-acetylglucosamine transferase (SPINDLY family)